MILKLNLFLIMIFKNLNRILNFNTTNLLETENIDLSLVIK